MYNSIFGKINYINETTLYLAAGYIEYEITCPSNFLQKLHLGEEIKVFTVLHHKEDIMKLFGFESVNQRDLFFQLLKVDGVGPKQGINILSYSDADDLKDIIDREDVASLTKIQGLGSKTASKIILALRGKLTSKEINTKVENEYQDIIKALVDMGFQIKIVEATVNKLLNQINKNEIDFEKKLFKQAIIEMSSM